MEETTRNVDGVVAKIQDYWLQALRVGRGHYLASESADRRNGQLGGSVVVLSALVATSAFATLASQPAVWWKVAAGALSAVAAVFAALQTFLRFSERASAHKLAATQYGKVRRQLELMALDVDLGQTAPGAVLEHLRAVADELATLASDSPHLPKRLYLLAAEEQAGMTLATPRQ